MASTCRVLWAWPEHVNQAVNTSRPVTGRRHVLTESRSSMSQVTRSQSTVLLKVATLLQSVDHSR